MKGPGNRPTRYDGIAKKGKGKPEQANNQNTHYGSTGSEGNIYSNAAQKKYKRQPGTHHS